MPPTQSREDQYFEAMFREEYFNFLRCAEIHLRKFGAANVSISGRAEEVVQETLALAWNRRSELMEKDAAVGWVYNSLILKVRELLREDRRWVKCLMTIPVPKHADEADSSLREWNDLMALMSRDEYELMQKIYLEGYSYRELSAEMGISITNLTTKVNRIKKRVREKYEKF